MSLIISSHPVKFIPTWKDNDKTAQPISMSLKRLKTDEFWRLTFAVDSLNETLKEGKDSKKVSDQINVMLPILESHVTNLFGIEIDGEQATIKKATEEPSLLALVMEIATKLINISGISDDEKKKSQSPSEAPSVQPNS